METMVRFFRQKVGPLETWMWLALVSLAAVTVIMYRRNKVGSPLSGPTAEGQTGGNAPSGEFQSSTEVSKIDPETGEAYSSSYSASGSQVVTPGGIGVPGGYPINFSPGDVFVNLPGQTTQPPGGSVSLQGTFRPAKYPPKSAPDTGGKGPVQGSKYMGSYWWTPQSKYDLEHLISRAYDLPTKEENLTPTLAFWYAVMYDRIRDANPQIDWTGQIPVGTPLFIPLEGAGARGDRTSPPSYVSRNAPSTYNPPPQQTVMQVAYPSAAA